MKFLLPVGLGLLWIVLAGCDQNERGRREAAATNLQEAGRTLTQHNAEKQEATDKPNLVTKEVREQEYDAFRAWIRAAVADPALMAAQGDALPIGPKKTTRRPKCNFIYLAAFP